MVYLVKVELILTTPAIGSFIYINIIYDRIIFKAESKVFIYKVTSNCNVSCHLTPIKIQSLSLKSSGTVSI